MSRPYTYFNPLHSDVFREVTNSAKPALILQHGMRACPGDLSHRKNMKKSVGQFAVGDTLCKTCRRRTP
jgi:hypothetical protein